MVNGKGKRVRAERLSRRRCPNCGRVLPNSEEL